MAKEPDQSNALHNKYKVSFNTATSYLVNIIVAGWKIYLTMLKVDQSTEYL